MIRMHRPHLSGRSLGTTVMQEKLMELGQRTPRLSIFQSKQLLAYIVLAFGVIISGLLASSLIGQVNRVACTQTEPDQFLCEVSLIGACPEINSYFGFVVDAVLPSMYGQECITHRQIQIGQPSQMAIFVAIGILIIAVGLGRASSQTKYIP